MAKRSSKARRARCSRMPRWWRPTWEASLLLEVENLELAYGEVPACRELSFNVGEGEIVALIGANGAGKSTTLRGVAGAMQPRKGRIVFQGKDVTRMPAHQRARAGLGPLVVQDIFRSIRAANAAGTSILLVEQNARYALETASRGYVLQTGRIIAQASCAALKQDPRVKEAYLGRR